VFHTEDDLLTELTACGFDFHTNLSEIAKKFPPVPNWGYENQLVIHYPLIRPFAGLVGEYKINLHDALAMQRPVDYWSAEFHPSMDLDDNFDLALNALTPLLGPGTPSDASNTKAREWDIGCFRIRIIAWPRELNSGFTNVYEGKNPYLWISTNIYVESRLPRIQRTEDYDLAQVQSQRLLPELSFRAFAPHYTYRNTLALEQSIGEHDSYCLCGPTHFRILTKESTLVIPRTEIEAVELGIAHPARGGGYWELALLTKPPEDKDAKPYRIAIHTNYSRNGGLPEAKSLAKGLGLPLKETSWFDE
jgi:hypothetical protein